MAPDVSEQVPLPDYASEAHRRERVRLKLVWNQLFRWGTEEDVIIMPTAALRS